MGEARAGSASGGCRPLTTPKSCPWFQLEAAHAYFIDSRSCPRPASSVHFSFFILPSSPSCLSANMASVRGARLSIWLSSFLFLTSELTPDQRISTPNPWPD
jgi:hypothetical protein